MTTTSQSYPRISGLAGGSSLIFGGLLWWLGMMNVRTAIFFSNLVPSTISAIFILIGMSILAVGIAKEPGIAGDSTVGKIALILFGGRNLVLIISGPFVFQLSVQSSAIFVGSTLQILFTVSGLMAAVCVWRAGVVPRPSRIVFLVVVLLFAFTSTFAILPLSAPPPLWITSNIVQLVAIAVILLGLTFILQGFASHRLPNKSPH